jgi:cytochrome c553
MAGVSALAAAAISAVAFIIVGPARAAEDGPPGWAYAADPPAAKGASPAPDDALPRHVPGSAVTLTPAQIADPFDAPDWHPDDHPPAPDVVMHGHRPALLACGYCHLPNGQGRPENAGLAGQPAAYIAQQIADFRAGLRRSSVPTLVPPALMIGMATAATDDEVKAAAAYFAGLKPRQWVRVVETATVPRTRIAGYMLVPAPDGGTEPIGHRIVETPENVAATELRDSGSGFIAYAPLGSIGRGQALATTGGGRTTPCGVCHGGDLRGLGPAPALAGRSPSYLVRQLYDLQHGARAGPWSPLMRAVVQNLTPDDMIALAAYAASLPP